MANSDCQLPFTLCKILNSFFRRCVSPLCAGLEKCGFTRESLLWQILRRGSFIPQDAYRLLVTSRPCYNVDVLQRESCFDRRLHLFGFTKSQRESFFLKYNMMVHENQWHAVHQRSKHLLEAADGFCELVTQLPFIATLLASNLPNMANFDVPQTRHRFMLQLLKPLVMHDLSDSERHHFLTEEKLFGAKYEEPLNLLGELALADLLSEFPEGGFTPTELKKKLDNRLVPCDEQAARSLIAVLTEHTVMKVGISGAYHFHRFLDPSIQQYAAAVAFVRSPLNWTIPPYVKHETLETFWLFAAGLCSDIAPSARREVFHKMTSCHDRNDLLPGVVETLTIMLEEAFPDLSDRATLQAHQDLFSYLSDFLSGNVHFCRRWALLKRPFRSIGHALHLLPNIRSVALYSLVPPPPASELAEVGLIFDCLMDGLKRQVNTLERIVLFLAPTTDGKDSFAPVSTEYTHKLIDVLQAAWRLDSFGCDWPFSYEDMILICQKGFATCPTLTEVGLSLRRGNIDSDALRVFATMVREHPNIVSLRLGDIGSSLPAPLFNVLAKSKLERLILNLTTPSPELLHNIAKLLEVNKSITALGISPSRFLNTQRNMLGPKSTHTQSAPIRALADAMQTRIKRLVLYTSALQLDDDGLMLMMDTILKVPQRQRVKQLHVVGDRSISQEGAQRLARLVKAYPPAEIVTTRSSAMDIPGLYKGHLSPWMSRLVSGEIPSFKKCM